MAESYRAGATVHELAGRFGPAHRTVSRMLRGQGVALRRQGLSPEQVDEAVRLYRSGWSLARIGQPMNVDPTTVLNRLRERRVQTRGPTAG